MLIKDYDPEVKSKKKDDAGVNLVVRRFRTSSHQGDQTECSLRTARTQQQAKQRQWWLAMSTGRRLHWTDLACSVIVLRACSECPTHDEIIYYETLNHVCKRVKQVKGTSHCCINDGEALFACSPLKDNL